jgi:3-hydroxyisobutyrate dehydrogenase-like beta-hydroxyacid dehydrogenase
MTSTIGFVGLGMMGGAMAHHILAEGFDVVGTDVVAAMRERHEQDGGRTVDSPAAVVAEADVIFTSLPSVAALDAVVSGPGGLVEGARPGVVVLETSTFPLEAKERARDALAAVGMTLLDGSLSGTGAQAWKKDLVVFVSGDAAASEKVLPAVQACSRAHYLLGEFGNGSRMKYLANLLVTIHNVAAAEAVTLGIKAGMDPQQVVEVLTAGSGSSRMLEIRGPAMAANDYSNPGIAGATFLKDVRIIGDFARSLNCPVPLFDIAGSVHFAAVAQGHGDHDTSSVCDAVCRAAGVVRD